jgi:type III pantothenate kinase
MTLAIDIGNTNIAFGLSDGTEWRHHWRIRTVADKTADEYGVLFSSFLRSEGIELNLIRRVVVSSVVPPLTGPFTGMINKLTGKTALIIGPGVKTGIRIRTDNPSEVGTDLVANAVASYKRYNGSCICIDFGTALTFTAVKKPGDLLGVVIAPGLNAAAGALSKHTAQLPTVRLEAPRTIVGKNSIHSIQGGIVYGYSGLVKEIIRKIQDELDEKAKVIATGGLVDTIAPLVAEIDDIDPWLTLEGLKLIGEMNSRE